MNAYEIGIKLALEDLGLEKLAQGFQSVSQMKDKAYARQRGMSSPASSLQRGPRQAPKPAAPQMRTPVTAPQVSGVTSRSSGGGATSRPVGSAPPPKPPPGRLSAPGTGMARQAQNKALAHNQRLRRALHGNF